MNQALQNQILENQKGWVVLSSVMLLHILFFWLMMHSRSHQALPISSMAQPLTVRWVSPEPEVNPVPIIEESATDNTKPEPLPEPKIETPSPVKIKSKPEIRKKHLKQIDKKTISKKLTQALPQVSAPIVTKTEHQQDTPPTELVLEQPKFNAAYLSNPAPVYPRRSRMLAEEGLVKLKVRVSADGQPLSVSLEKSSGFTRLDDAALAAVKRWQFVPAKRGNQSIEGWVIVPVSFKLRS